MRTPEMRQVARSLAGLALVRVEEGRELNVRRTEDVRRALQEAAEGLGWAESVVLTDDPINAAVKDVKKLVQGGVRSLRSDLDKEIAEKEAEPQRSLALLVEVEKLGKDKKAEFPAEIVFSRTAKNATGNLVTKTETLMFESAKEVPKALESVERSIPGWEKLALEMLGELEETRERLGSLGRSLPEVVAGWHPLLRHVLRTLQ